MDTLARKGLDMLTNEQFQGWIDKNYPKTPALDMARWAYDKACDDCAKGISTRKVEEDNTDRFNAYCHAQDDCLSLKTKTLDSGGSDGPERPSRQST